MTEISQEARRAKMAEKFKAARIPPYASRTTLAALGQHVLRSVIVDKAYMSLGQPQSICLTEPERPTINGHVTNATVFTRFAADLCLAGQPVFYAHAVGICEELRRHVYQSDVDPLNPVLDIRGAGYIAVPDLYNSYLTNRETSSVCDFLLNHVTLGGQLLVGKFGVSGSVAGEVTAEFEAMLESSSFLKFSVQV